MLTCGREADDLFGQSLGRPHDGGGTHRLIGRDQHEMRHAMLDGGFHHVARAHDIIRHGLDDILLHERHVLVCRRVEDGERLVPAEDIREPSRVAHVGDDRDHREFGKVPPKFAIDLEDLVLRVVDEDQEGGGERADLATELTADRSAGTRDEHHAIAAQRPDLVHVRLDGCTPEEVMDLDRSQCRHLDVPGHEVGEAGDGACACARNRGEVDHTAHQSAAGGGDGDDDLFGREGPDEAWQVIHQTLHAYAVQQLAELPRIIIDEAHDLEARPGRCE